MIDFKNLERLLDEALDKETPESMEQWLLSHRKRESIHDSFNNTNNCESVIDQFKKIYYNYNKIDKVMSCQNVNSHIKELESWGFHFKMKGQTNDFRFNPIRTEFINKSDIAS